MMRYWSKLGSDSWVSSTLIIVGDKDFRTSKVAKFPTSYILPCAIDILMN